MNKPLQGRRILVTRPAAQAAGLGVRIAAERGHPVFFPLLEIAPADDLQPLHRAIARLEQFFLAVFVSPNAVEYSLPHILDRRPWPEGVRPAAVGPGSVACLERFGLRDALVPQERFDSEALLALDALQADRIAGKSVLLLRGNGGRELLADTLRARGASVECVTCYRRSAPADGSALVSLLRNSGLDAALVTSSESLRNLLALLDTESCGRLFDLPVFVPHARIAEEAARLGLRRAVLTRPADAGLVAGLCNYHWPDHE